jgi:hypothetical protein
MGAAGWEYGRSPQPLLSRVQNDYLFNSQTESLNSYARPLSLCHNRGNQTLDSPVTCQYHLLLGSIKGRLPQYGNKPESYGKQALRVSIRFTETSPTQRALRTTVERSDDSLWRRIAGRGYLATYIRY